jgi:hypothetical protein
MKWLFLSFVRYLFQGNSGHQDLMRRPAHFDQSLLLKIQESEAECL